ncbi:heterokaryon incompatibility, partial [Alternaria alternata]
PEYRALSYVWGPPSPVQEIQVNGHRFLVRQNLYDFIYAFRERLYKFRGGNGYEDEVQWLWIDQVCINQALTGERNHQVKMMSDIYRRATYVYVWLGKSDGSTEAVMRAKMSRDGTSTQAEDSIWTSALRSALRHFFGNPYWLRLWIVQEIMLA